MFAALTFVVLFVIGFFAFAVYAHREGTIKTTRGWSDEDRKVLMYLVQQLMLLKGYKIVKRRELPAIHYTDSAALDGASVGEFAAGYTPASRSITIGARQSGISVLAHELVHWCQPDINEGGHVLPYTQEKDPAKARELYKADPYELEAKTVQNMVLLATALRFSLFSFMAKTKAGRAAMARWEAMPWNETVSLERTLEDILRADMPWLFNRKK